MITLLKFDPRTPMSLPTRRSRFTGMRTAQFHAQCAQQGLNMITHAESTVTRTQALSAMHVVTVEELSSERARLRMERDQWQHLSKWLAASVHPSNGMHLGN